ncbi:MAG: ABC transporter ATP-binding protein [Anaerolineae bacterium]
MNRLTTHNLTIGYVLNRKTRRVIASDVSLSLRAGELVCLIGPNGSGKSTLLRTLAGTQKPLSGHVLLEGHHLHQLPVQELARLLSIVITDYPKTALMTGYGLVALGRHPYTNWSGRLTPHDERVIQWAVRAVDAESFANAPVSALSDGQRQKIMIARALAQEPRVMLLDEPTAYLDLPRRVEITHLLRDLAHQTGCAVLLSTHDLDLALRTADRIWLMSEGALLTGTPEDLVLNGAFETAFASSGVLFDIETGAFKLSAPAGQAVALSGEGTGYIWTQRALERAGFTVDHRQARWCVEVREASWRLHHADTITTYTSIQDLLTALEALRQ